MTDDNKPEITIEGYFRKTDLDNFQNPKYLGGTSENGKDWHLGSFGISVTCSTFSNTLIEQIKGLDDKQQLRIKGVPGVRWSKGKRYFAITITSIEDNDVIAMENPPGESAQNIPLPDDDDDLEETFL